MMNELEKSRNLERAARLLDGADMLIFVTGAGMGVDSGLPDFRGNQGFWRAYPALGRDRIDFISIASPRAFRRQPDLAWGFYGHRLALYRQTTPHQGYQILKKWGGQSPCGYAAFTSNVDGHFQKAGLDAGLVTECHGSIHHLQCLDACTTDIWPANGFTPMVDEENCRLLNEPPACPHCGGLARPNIYMFGDEEWLEHRTYTQHRRLEHWLRDAERLLVIEIGAGTAIPTARDFTHRLAFELRAPVIRINPQDASIHGNPGHVSLTMNGLEALRAVDALLMAP
jgi:NAD-dependent SIR2 family protein deacetylase